jgi:glycosyltransferase involved in cell wall biosynthesis
LKLRVLQKLFPGESRWFTANQEFDLWVARELASTKSEVFVGTETCALRSFEIGKKKGLKLVLDCPGIESSLRDELAKQAAREFQLDEPHPSDSLEILRWKESEVALADYLLAYSVVHRESLLRRGAVANKVIEIPLWADCDFWYPAPQGSDPANSALKVLYAGGISLRKGIPYLLAAANECGPAVNVTLAGTVADEMKPVLAKYRNHQLLPHQNRAALRDLYWRSDVLVLPSLGESWGFVALEAMLCGLPVVVTENCGAPVPDESWRVPVMDSRAIGERLLLYANDRSLCREHGSIAVPFARQFTPERYRQKLAAFFQKVLDEL